jgi:hypothetical protein
LCIQLFQCFLILEEGGGVFVENRTIYRREHSLDFIGLLGAIPDFLCRGALAL